MAEGEKYSEAGFLQRSEGNKITTNPLSIDEVPQPSPEQEKLFEIDTDNGVAQKLKEARAIGPSVRQQTQAEILNLVLLYRELGGNPFSVRRLPFSIMRDMAADPTIAFALYYTETPLVNATWSIECEDAQIAAAVDAAFRPINSDFKVKSCNKLRMGYQPLVKRWKLGKLEGKYRDRNSDNPDEDKPVWPSKNVDALLWKTFLALPPENCLPRWSEDGSFAGMMYSPVPIPNPMMLGVAQTYGPQVLSGYPIPLDRSMWMVNERTQVFGCQPPDDRVLMSNGKYINIGDLDPRLHKISTYDHRSNSVIGKGYRPKDGYDFEKGERFYSGNLIKITSDKKNTIRVTPNHKFTVKWNKDSEKLWVVYLMKRGGWWRIGTSKAAHPKSKSTARGGVSERASREKADKTWIIGVFDSKQKALFYESLWGHIYNVPEWTFEASGSAADRKEQNEYLHTLWSTIDSESGGKKLLSSKGLYEGYPLIQNSNNEVKPLYANRWTVYGANLCPDLMEIPSYNSSCKNPEWSSFKTTIEHYEGNVVSLEVNPHRHYITNGIITQNSLYGQPRLRRAYRYWWSFWYRWALADRSYENKADPAKIVYFPTAVAEGLDANNPEGETVYGLQQKAIQIGNNIRSGTTAAFPGDFMVGEDGKTLNQRQWEAKYMDGGQNFTDLEQCFATLQAYILRCVTADTPIDCPRNHERFPDGKPISMLKPGDLVWTFNTDDLKFELNKIKASLCTQKDQRIFKIELSNGKSIRATGNHPFLTTDLIWKTVSELENGDKIVSLTRDFEPFVKLDPTDHGRPRNIEYRETAKAIGFDSSPGKHIHHIEAKHYNNDPDNLANLSNSEHMALERTGRRMKESTRKKVRKARLIYEKNMVDSTCKVKNEDDDLLLEEREYYIENGLRGTQKNKMYKPKICVGCGRKYAPTQGGEQKHCKACGHLSTIEEHRNLWRKDRYKDPPTFKDLCDYVTIISVENDGSEDVWDIAIDAPDHSKNFVVNGAVLHNSMFLPEQAFIDATSAAQSSSQRYIAAQQGEIYQESQQILSNEDDEHVNKYMIPEFIAANFPAKAGIPCKKVTRKLRNPEFIKQLITLLGQKNPENLGVDTRALLEEEGVRTNSEAQQKIVDEKHKAEIENSKPPLTEPTKKEGIAGYNAGVEKTETGEHVYFQPGGEIYLGADSLLNHYDQKSFLQSLPKTPPYQDATVRTAAIQMRKLLRDRYKGQITSFANQIRNRTVLKLAQPEEPQPSKPGLSAGAAKMAAAGAVAAWTAEQATGFPPVASKLKEIIGRIAGAAGKRELKLAQLDPAIFNPDDLEKWAGDYAVDNLSLMDQTVQEQFKEFLEQQLARDSHPDRVAQAIEDYFSDLPETHSTRAVRAQTRDAYNEGMLKAGEDAGIDQVMGHDASSGTNLNTDPKCIRRNGKVFSIKDARKETEHPNGTLFWTYLNTSNLSVKITDDIPDSLELNDNMMAGYDADNETLYIKTSVKSSEEKYMIALAERLAFR